MYNLSLYMHLGHLFPSLYKIMYFLHYFKHKIKDSAHSGKGLFWNYTR